MENSAGNPGGNFGYRQFQPDSSGAGFNPYQRPLSAGQFSPGAPHTRLSSAALASLILSLLSPLLFCTCVGPIVVSLIAVVLGHVGHSQIRRSAGQLTGTGVAITGLIFGYLGLLGFGSLFLYTITRPSALQPAAQAKRSAPGPLDKISAKINSDVNGVAQGNTEEAKVLAGKFSAAMTTKDILSFTESKAKRKRSGDKYVTWCELREGRCVFVTYVPQYRKFSKSAKDHLNELAWETAQEVIAETLQPDDDLAIGLKGDYVFGGVMTGKVGEPTPDTTGTNSQALLKYFRDDLANPGENENNDDPLAPNWEIELEGADESTEPIQPAAPDDPSESEGPGEAVDPKEPAPPQESADPAGAVTQPTDAPDRTEP